MGPVARGLLLTAIWMGLALGFTEVLSNTLFVSHVVDVQRGATTVR
jgi:hypothetical protein